MKNFRKEIILSILFLIELTITYLSFYNKWGSEISSALLFGGILILFQDLTSILSKLDTDHKQMREQEKIEHDQIKGMMELYKDIEKLEYVTYFEGNYISTQNSNQNCVEIWIISNSIAEPDEVIEKIYDNLIKGIKYYYVIPNNPISVIDLKNTAKKLKEKDKKNKLNLNNFVYIQDDLFDLMPTDLIDILFYCNPLSTDYQTNLKVFYSFQDEKRDSIQENFYKPAELTERDIQEFFSKMNEWKKRNWKKLLIEDNYEEIR